VGKRSGENAGERGTDRGERGHARRRLGEVGGETGAASIALAALLAGVLVSIPAAGADALLAAEAGERTLLQNILLLVGILVLAVTVIRIGLRRRPGGRARERSQERSIAGAAHPARGGGPAAEIERVLIQIQETGREIEARLDTKIRFAQRLLQESEEALRELDLARARATEAAERMAAGELPRRAGASAPVAGAVGAAGDLTPKVAAPASRSPASPKEKKSAPAEIAPVRDRIASPPPESARARAAAPRVLPIPPEQKSQDRIRALAAEGRDAKQIAREVGRPIGEVQLIIALGKGDEPGQTPSSP